MNMIIHYYLGYIKQQRTKNGKVIVFFLFVSCTNVKMIPAHTDLQNGKK